MPKSKLRRVLTPHEKADNYVDKHRLRGYDWLDKLESRVTFIDGVEQTDPTNDEASSITDRSAA
jgi:hypothetical protein